MRHAIFLLASVLPAACGNVIPTSSDLTPHYVRQFNALYDERQAAYDDAFRALGSTTPSTASPAQLHQLFIGLANADDSFIEGIGHPTSPETGFTTCQPGSFAWKIRFPINDCPDIVTLWRAGYSLASDERAVAATELTLQVAADNQPEVFAKVSDELERWRSAANKVRQDIGLPPQSFDLQGLCLAATTC